MYFSVFNLLPISFLYYLYQCMCHTITSKLMDEKGKPIIQC